MSELERPAPVATFTRVDMLGVAALIGGFIGVVAWFDWVDFYNKHFFDAGAIVFADNVVRIIFLGIFCWLIYAPGAAVLTRIMPPRERAALSAAEHAVLSFGIGAGIWYVVMLILGVLDLYYRWIMAGLCLIVLVASARCFARTAVAGCCTLAARFTDLRQLRASPQTIGAIVVAAVVAWLIVRRGLFPGGGSDYFTHYFYYYLEVLKNHGLAPNDVWYQYYYSKGSGLAFLGMLLTDPEAPALSALPCVVCAAVAVATLAGRLAPGSLWPTAGVLVYLLFYLVGLNGGISDGEFQKDHEGAAAFVVLFTWALCMERCGPPRPFRIMAAAVGIATAILNQPVAILLGQFAGLLCAWSILRRRWSDMWGYGWVAAAITAAVLAMFVLSYFATGLPHDQFYELTLNFANFDRLDRWGVIPMVIAEVWIRDNYLALVPPFGWEVFKQLFQFMRLRGLWPFLIGPIIAAFIIYVMDRFSLWTRPRCSDPSETSFAGATAARLAALLLFFIVISLLVGRAQSISFERVSTFFVPLLVLFAIACSAWLLNGKLQTRGDPWTWTILPAVLLIAVLGAWQGKDHWTRRVPAETANALRFFVGRSSLADAYAHVDSIYPYGAIYPGALAAARQLPYGTPIWSTNGESYCMVPGCLIEDVVSFKMSGRLDEILSGAPDLAKRRLQEAGLNYFLFTKEFRMIDLLPFSRLFAPDTIGRYLGIKWTDGTTFLLTWIGPDTRPIGPDFLDAYKRRRSEPDASRWFKFDELAPIIATIAPRMRSVTEWGAAQALFSWR